MSLETRIGKELYEKHGEEFESLEKLTEMTIKETLFDSDVNGWNMCDYDFPHALYGKSQIAIVVIDTNQNVFGVYVNSRIGDFSEYVYDPNAFVFSLKSNGRLEKPMKFPIKNNSQAFQYNAGSHSYLFSVGCDASGDIHDIMVMKKDCQDCFPGTGCNQTSYEYHGIENALCGGTEFVPKQIYILQMYTTEEQKNIHFTREQRFTTESVLKLFAMFDKDKSGKISKSEFDDLMKCRYDLDDTTMTPLTKKIINGIFEASDGCGTFNSKDGQLNKKEFERIALLLPEPTIDDLDEKLTMVIFKLIDKDKSGTINVSEFKNFMSKMKMKISSKDATSKIKEFDADKSGKLEPKEFFELIKALEF